MNSFAVNVGAGEIRGGFADLNGERGGGGMSALTGQTESRDRRRNMLRTAMGAEIAAAWALRKRDAGVLYGLTMGEIERDRGGLAMLAPTNIVAIDEFDDYISELSERIEASKSL